MENEEPTASTSGLIYDGGKRCSLFVIDFGEAMFAADNDDSQKHFRLALKAVRDRVNFLCCTGGANELAALIFINTTKTNKDAENVDCIFVKRPIGPLDAEFVKELDALLASENPRRELSSVLGSESGTCNWGELMFICQRMLTYCGVILRRRQIFFFTVDGDPTINDESILRSVRSYVSDLRARDTQLSVCLVDVAANKPADEANEDGDEGNHVDVNPFWSQIDANVLQSSSFERLQNEVMRKDVAMRTTASIPMRLGGTGFRDDTGVVLAVGVYCLIKEQSRPPAISLDADTNEPLEYRAHYVTAAKSELVEPTNSAKRQRVEDVNGGKNGEAVASKTEEHYEGNINFARQIGGETVVLDRAEMEGLRRFDDPGLTVIGFKPLRCLKHSHRVGPSKYVYPLDEAVGGSATLYRALFQRCAERELFVLARYTEKLNTPPQLVALTPQRRNNDGSISDDYRYDGFHLIELPYAEDKRSLEDRFHAISGDSKLPDPSDMELEAAKGFVRRLTTKYAPHQFTNPVLQRFYCGLEAMALDLDTEQLETNPRIKDKIRPYFEDPILQRRVAGQLDALKYAFPGCVIGGENENAPKKRRGPVGKNKDAVASNSAPPAAAKRGRRKKE